MRLFQIMLGTITLLEKNSFLLGDSKSSFFVGAFVSNTRSGVVYSSRRKGNLSNISIQKEIDLGRLILFYKNKDGEGENLEMMTDVMENEPEEDDGERMSETLHGSNGGNELRKNSWKNPFASLPPMQIEDTSLLFYDVFLILNLSVSISFWVVHRMTFSSLVPAFSEGSLLSILWVVSGLINGSFLYSATEGHYDVSKEEYRDKGGPNAAGMLGLFTYIGAANMRLFVALVMSLIEHRKFGITDGEELIPLELACGLVLMSIWRMLHSSYTRL